VKRAGRVAQVLQYLLCKCEVLSSNASTTKKKVNKILRNKFNKKNTKIHTLKTTKYHAKKSKKT
jgi:hypothetical protein